ncbi:MAG: RNA polymerase sigma factor [Patescibacteria group bacterium]
MTTKQEAEQEAQMTLAHADFDKMLNSYAFFKVNNREIGQDLVQDTFMKTWNYLLKGGKIDTMKSFLYHVLNNLIVDEYRKRKNKSSSLDVLLDAGFEPGIDESDRLINIFDGKSAILLIQNLPMAYQAVMTMRYEKDLSLKEISIITGKSENSIAVQVHRGLGKLKILYNSHVKL